MDDKLYQDDFEEFLQNQVRNHRMYPNDTVWRKINKELHGDKNWPALTIAAFVVLIATIAVSVYFSPKPNIFAIGTDYNNQKLNTGKATNTTNENSTASFLNTQKHYSVSNSNWFTNSDTKKNTSAFMHVTPAGTNNLTLAEKDKTIPLNRSDKSITPASLSKSFQIITTTNRLEDITNTLGLSEGVKENALSQPLNSTMPVTENNDIIINQKQPVVQTQPSKQEFNDKNMVDDFLKDHKDDLSLYTATQHKSVKNKFNYLVYLAPSISYRKLTEDPALAKSNTSGGPVALNYVTDVNNVVRHKPGTGIEAGVSILYNLTDKLRIKSGLQFNMRQYNIEAYRSNREQASIALITNNRKDTINASSVYRTNNGYSAAEITNRYFQLAIPIGLEWEIIGNKKIQFNVAGSIQPTYLLNKNAYLLSSNFKNYAESSNMVNSLNINSNIETFISFKAGDYKWQFGPQLRYQHLPTFIRQYPIKEHLIDYGIKLGVSKIIL